MLKLLMRFGIGFVVLFLTALGAFLIYVHTRPVRISPNKPTINNDDLVQKILSAKNVLFIGAHPDDIEFYCASLIHKMRKNDTTVTFAIATRGGKGRVGNAKARLEELRSMHQKDAADILGGADIVFYDYPDKNLSSHINKFAEDIEELINKEKTDLVLAWDPDYIYNPHLDHQAAANAAKKALINYKGNICYYGTCNPNTWFGYDKSESIVKYKSLRVHRTETPWPYSILVKHYLIKKTSGEGVKIGVEYAETYRW